MIASDIISISIGRLFIAGIVPGVLLAISLLIASMIVNKRNQKRQVDNGEAAVTIEKAQAIEVTKAFLKALLGLMIPIIILGGIYSGMFTPTEAAVVAVFLLSPCRFLVLPRIEIEAHPKNFSRCFCSISGYYAYNWSCLVILIHHYNSKK